MTDDFRRVALALLAYHDDTLRRLAEQGELDEESAAAAKAWTMEYARLVDRNSENPSMLRVIEKRIREAVNAPDKPINPRLLGRS